MPDYVAPPPPKRSHSRRLRKKMRVGEFQRLGFDYELIWQPSPSRAEQDQFIDQLLEEVIAPRGLSLGGGLDCGFIAARMASVTAADREAFETWLHRWAHIADQTVGPLRDAWYDTPA